MQIQLYLDVNTIVFLRHGRLDGNNCIRTNTEKIGFLYLFSIQNRRSSENVSNLEAIIFKSKDHGSKEEFCIGYQCHLA